MLKEEGIDPGRLALYMLGGAECIIGELLSDPPSGFGLALAGQVIKIKDPKRVFRRQSQQGQIIQVEYFMNDLDLMSGGTMEIVAVGVAPLAWMDDISRLSYMGVYLTYFDNQREQRAAKSGITLAKPKLVGPHG